MNTCAWIRGRHLCRGDAAAAGEAAFSERMPPGGCGVAAGGAWQGLLD